jgi:DNA-binding MarR family transcriptional regulator
MPTYSVNTFGSSGLSKLLDRMNVAGLVRRIPDDCDARATLAEITTAGRTLVKAARASHHELLARTFGDALDDRNLSDLVRMMDRLDAVVANRDGRAASSS